MVTDSHIIDNALDIRTDN